MPRFIPSSIVAAALFAVLCVSAPARAQQAQYDLVIANGRVIDPESGLDATRFVGIRNGKVEAISTTPIAGKQTIDAKGLVVAPGFIDLHAHGQDDENYRLFAMDGVTTALELEIGTEDVPRFYKSREGKALINYGASSSHVRSRMVVMKDPSTGLVPTGPGGHEVATDAQLDEIRRRVDANLAAGGLGVGMGLQYTPAATRYEVLEIFRTAAKYKAPVFVHVRSFGTKEPGSSVESFLEVIGASAITGAPVHIVHLNSMSLESTPKTLAMVKEARDHGLDVTTEAYPYIAGMTEIGSALLDQYVGAPDSVVQRITLVSTGARLTRASFDAERKKGGDVILFLNTPEMEAMAITSPLTAIASDGGLEHGKGHPRTAGTEARILSHYVRETKQLTLTDAIRKMSLMPAQRLEKLAPIFKNKGRIKVGADADITIFDPNTVADRSTYQQPALASVGFKYVLVNGIPVVQDGAVRGHIFPGVGQRAPIH
jgi:N-acyl-D-aspartate/D-glutamate deacylase